MPLPYEGRVLGLNARYMGLGFRGRAPVPVRVRAILNDPLRLGFKGELLSLKGLGRSSLILCCNQGFLGLALYLQGMGSPTMIRLRAL